MRRVAGAVLTLVLTGSPGDAAQGQTQPPVFRARTDLVRLDVVVVDADGQVTRGLTKEDFQSYFLGCASSRLTTSSEISTAGLR